MPQSQIKALLFDVFGTVVDWRSSVGAELEALGKTTGAPSGMLTKDPDKIQTAILLYTNHPTRFHFRYRLGKVRRAMAGRLSEEHVCISRSFALDIRADHGYNSS